MDISFGTTKLKKLCSSGRDLAREFGQPCAKKVNARLEDLASSDSLAEFRHLPGRCHELDGDRSGQLALVLPDGKRLIFEPAASPAPAKPDGGLDWAAVDSIRIIAIEDYH